MTRAEKLAMKEFSGIKSRGDKKRSLLLEISRETGVVKELKLLWVTSIDPEDLVWAFISSIILEETYKMFIF